MGSTDWPSVLPIGEALLQECNAKCQQQQSFCNIVPLSAFTLAPRLGFCFACRGPNFWDITAADAIVVKCRYVIEQAQLSVGVIITVPEGGLQLFLPACRCKFAPRRSPRFAEKRWWRWRNPDFDCGDCSWIRKNSAEVPTASPTTGTVASSATWAGGTS